MSREIELLSIKKDVELLCLYCYCIPTDDSCINEMRLLLENESGVGGGVHVSFEMLGRVSCFLFSLSLSLSLSFSLSLFLFLCLF